MSAPSIGEELFTTGTQGECTSYVVNGDTVAVAMPAPQPHNEDAWYVCLFDPFGGPTTGGHTRDSDGAHELAAMFARTAARAVAR
ncbi:hypothetical protein [Mycobacterium sp. PSTR-4-N]|uniref:hypothetical protein n=1 Tax=Mycobacterium sp. PSTR-4-N TaxID=2917745 RepID=UPI001F150C3A|nr:hypothetical protein [Mycobacterium sp. PSTR-4-N]MCG7592443.1 hypothetical protein [Mycobacterium sp. PSTR-4-N]